jgi:hypothetical protein
MPKKVVDAKSDSKGRTTAVRLQGNTTFTPIETAKRMAERGQISNAHVVHPKRGDSYLRTNPDSREGNNLDQMSGDK